MKIIVKEDLVSDEVSLRLYDKGIHILSDHTIVHERGSHTLEYFKPTQSQLKKYLSQNHQIFVNTMPDLSVNEVQGFDVYVSSFNSPKKNADKPIPKTALSVSSFTNLGIKIGRAHV